MLGSLLSLGIGAGRSNSANPNGFSAPSWIGSDLSKLDPIGNWITSVGGDPLNLYGNKNNPNALFFPGPNSQQTGQGTPVPIGSGFSPDQLSQLSQSYNTFLSNLGAGNTPMLPTGKAQGTPASGQTTPMGGTGPGNRLPDLNTLKAIASSQGRGGMGLNVGQGNGRRWAFGPYQTP